MNRREFLVYGASFAALTGASWAGFKFWQELNPELDYPGMQTGHFLRNWAEKNNPQQQQALIAQAPSIKTDVLILGSGIAGLTAAWRLQKSGLKDFILLDGPSPYGNAAGGEFALAGETLPYPKGAHYLPLPGQDASHVREILFDLGVITANPNAEQPTYDERYLLHAPHERVFYQGKWLDGVYPEAALNADEQQQFKQFFQQMAQISSLIGKDGKRVFTIPSALSSLDEEWRALDKDYFSDWLMKHHYTSPTLLSYLNYCCRDDYGRNIQQVSAWAGLHYFCARDGKAFNAAEGTWLTWENGLQFLASGLANFAKQQHQSGSALRVEHLTADSVRAFCVDFKTGKAQYFNIIARKVICAFPLHVAAKTVPMLSQNWVNLKQYLPQHAPWLVANYLLDAFPSEQKGVPLAWDNVIYDSPCLGYIVSTHQQIRRSPPNATVFTVYRDLANFSPQQARTWLTQSDPQTLLDSVSFDLKTAYDWYISKHTKKVELTIHGHAMAYPQPNTLSNPLLQQLRLQQGNILFAHSDLSGFSLFEEASWWGNQAALRCL